MNRLLLGFYLLSYVIAFNACAQNPATSSLNNKAQIEDVSPRAFYYGQLKGEPLPYPLVPYLETLRHCLWSSKVQAQSLLLHWNGRDFVVEKGLTPALKSSLSCLKLVSNKPRGPVFWIWTTPADKPPGVEKNFAMIAWNQDRIQEKSK